MQINRYINGQKIQGEVPRIQLENTQVKEVIRAVNTRQAALHADQTEDLFPDIQPGESMFYT